MYIIAFVNNPKRRYLANYMFSIGICANVNRIADMWHVHLTQMKTTSYSHFHKQGSFAALHSKLVDWQWHRYSVPFIRMYMTSKLHTSPLGSGWTRAHWTRVRLDGSDYRLQMSGGQTCRSLWLYHIIVLVHGWSTTNRRGWTDSGCVKSASYGRKLRDFRGDGYITLTCNYRCDTICTLPANQIRHWRSDSIPFSIFYSIVS